MKQTPAVWTFRQSWTKDFLLCPDRGRRSAFDPVFQANNVSSDATTLGTALHEYAEMRLRRWDHNEAAHHALEWLQSQIDAETFVWVKIKTAKTLMATLERVIEKYQTVVNAMIAQYGYPPEHEIERTFNVPLSPDGLIRLSGTWDVRWPAHRIIADHKTAANFDHYVGWQVERWFVQPTVYCVAADMVDLVDQCGGDEELALRIYWATIGDGISVELPETEFQFHAVTKGVNPDYLQVDAHRDKRHAGWLLDKLQRIVTLHDEVGPDKLWPVNDQHALCSEKWCPAWADCKGKYLG